MSGKGSKKQGSNKDSPACKRYLTEQRWNINAKRRQQAQVARTAKALARHAKKGILGVKGRKEARNEAHRNTTPTTA